MEKPKSFVGEPLEVGGGLVFINLGTGPVEGADVANAAVNMTKFVEDLELEVPVVINRCADLDADGRYGFALFTEQHSTTVEMPGLPLEEVRYLSNEQNIGDFPRLYVDGSSWVWVYALSSAKQDLLGTEDD